jgi:hypothetical protein
MSLFHALLSGVGSGNTWGGLIERHVFTIGSATSVTMTFSATETAIWFATESWDVTATHNFTVTMNDGAGTTSLQTQAAGGTLYWGIYIPGGFTTITIACPSCAGGYSYGGFID